MTRTDFLADSHIRGFSHWVAQRFTCDGNWRHTYVNRDSGDRWMFRSVADAFRQYEWNGKPWSENFSELTTYRRQLRKAIADSNPDAAFEVCEAVFRWGHVWANNGRTLAMRKPGLLDELRHVSAVLTCEGTPTKSDMNLGRIACSMNAGFVKIYSVLLDYCVIYDGRVGAALGLFARQYCEIHGLPAVPPTLAFAYGPPKGPRTRNVRSSEIQAGAHIDFQDFDETCAFIPSRRCGPTGSCRQPWRVAQAFSAAAKPASMSLPLACSWWATT